MFIKYKGFTINLEHYDDICKKYGKEYPNRPEFKDKFLILFSNPSKMQDNRCLAVDTIEERDYVFNYIKENFLNIIPDFNN